VISLGGALPFVRITRTAGVVRGQRFLFGSRAGLQRQGIQDAVVKCAERVCIAETSLQQRVDWESLVTATANTDLCPPPGSDVIPEVSPTIQIQDRRSLGTE
jgi:hypothetical protein